MVSDLCNGYEKLTDGQMEATALFDPSSTDVKNIYIAHFDCFGYTENEKGQ